MDWNNSTTMREFAKIAVDKGLVKEASPSPNPYQEDPKTIEDKRLPAPEKSIMEEAHPEPVYVAESRGDGGLVENELEHQQKVVEMINKMPTGSLVGRYASAASELVKLAENCDELGHETACDILTEAAQDIIDALENQSPPLA